MMKKWFKRFNLDTLGDINLKWSSWILFLLAYIDASFFPVPVSTTFLLLVLLQPHRSLRYVIFSILGTYTGALSGYIIGSSLLGTSVTEASPFMQFLFSHIPGFSQEAYLRLEGLYSRWGFWILSGASFIPLPYGLFSITAGSFGINIVLFTLSVLLSQILKFFLLAFVIARMSLNLKSLISFRLRSIIVIASGCVITILFVTGVI